MVLTLTLKPTDRPIVIFPRGTDTVLDRNFPLLVGFL